MLGITKWSSRILCRASVWLGEYRCEWRCGGPGVSGSKVRGSTRCPRVTGPGVKGLLATGPTNPAADGNDDDFGDRGGEPDPMDDSEWLRRALKREGIGTLRGSEFRVAVLRLLSGDALNDSVGEAATSGTCSASASAIIRDKIDGVADVGVFDAFDRFDELDASTDALNGLPTGAVNAVWKESCSDAGDSLILISRNICRQSKSGFVYRNNKFIFACISVVD